MVASGDDDESYGLRLATVSNLDSLRELRGRDFEFRAASGVDETLFDAKINRGRRFALEWGEDEDGAVVPADLHSLMALSAYRALDQTASLFRDFGIRLEKPLTVMYMPRYDHSLLGDMRMGLTDNAAYSFEFRALLLLPSFVLAELPLLLNQGVLAHELGHAIVHESMFGMATDIPDSGMGSAPEGWMVARRHLAAMHEGVADLVGFVVTADPNFLAVSIPVDRDLSQAKTLSASQFKSLNTAEEPLPGLFDPHTIGSVMARAVFEMWVGTEPDHPHAAREELGRSIVQALRRLEFHPDSFSLASFPSAIVEVWLDGLQTSKPEKVEAERKRCCEILDERLGIGGDWFSVCEGGS